MSFLFESKRLLFREFSLQDAEDFFDLNNDADVMKYTGDMAFESIEASADLIRNYSAYTDSGFGRWTVLLKTNNKVIGWAGLKRHSDNSVDLGYRFHKKFWNQGLGSEAAAACLKFGFEQLNIDEIIGRTAKENIASIKILEKIGMRFWKFAPCEGIENSVFYKITKDEFKQP